MYLAFFCVFSPIFHSEISCDLGTSAVISFLSDSICFREMETHALSLCWGSYSLVIDSIWLSRLHTCGWCLLSCMTSKGGSIGWHLNLWLMFSVLGWARGTALAEFSSCRRVCAERPWPHASSHTGKASWGWGHPLLSSSDVHEIRLGTWQCVIFAKPLMMCNTSLGGGLVWGWRPQRFTSHDNDWTCQGLYKSGCAVTQSELSVTCALRCWDFQEM